ITTAPSVITTATRILRPSGGCRAPAWATGPAASAITTSIMRTRTARIMRIMGHPLLKVFCRLLTRVVPPAVAERTKNAQFMPSAQGIVPRAETAPAGVPGSPEPRAGATQQAGASGVLSACAEDLHSALQTPCRPGSVVEPRLCSPLVGSSDLSAGRLDIVGRQPGPHWYVD